MLTVNKYKDTLLKEFYLDSDDITIRRATEGYRGRWKQHDSVTPYKLCKHGYAGIHVPRTRITVNASHLITILRGIDIPEGCVIDHKDGDTLNNARANLRVTTQKVNCKNKKVRFNATGYTGITQDKDGKYIIRLTIQGKRKYLGYTATLEEALKLKEQYAVERKLDGYTTRHDKNV